MVGIKTRYETPLTELMEKYFSVSGKTLETFINSPAYFVRAMKGNFVSEVIDESKKYHDADKFLIFRSVPARE